MLDLDGTLLDIAPTPDSVRVEAGLVDALVAIRAALGGALAAVTGRPIGQVDGLMPGVFHAVAGEHGGAIRPGPEAEEVRVALPDAPVAWLSEAEAAVARYPGALLERKRRGFVMHYRGAPEAGEALRAVADGMVADGAAFQVMPALMAWEIRPIGADKGSAVRALMGQAPFAGRVPVFIGDDVTDEEGMAVAREIGGAGLRVDAAFGSAAGVRAWLAASATALSGGGGWPVPVQRHQ